MIMAQILFALLSETIPDALTNELFEDSNSQERLNSVNSGEKDQVRSGISSLSLTLVRCISNLKLYTHFFY